MSVWGFELVLELVTLLEILAELFLETNFDFEFYWLCLRTRRQPTALTHRLLFVFDRPCVV